MKKIEFPWGVPVGLVLGIAVAVYFGTEQEGLKSILYALTGFFSCWISVKKTRR